jgi:hypothetical protein
MGGMEKSTVYLSSEQKAALAGVAEATGRSEAGLIRDGIDVVTSRHRTGEALTPVDLPVRPDFERPRWITRDALVAVLARAQADARLRQDLRELAPDTTDDEAIS